jgi:GT2 family glycosyltransferase
VSCVISTWNKRDDVRANLLALYQQTQPPQEIVVVDNHSTDGTAEMIRSEFPEVRLQVMPHSRCGACETFNLGFKAASSPFVAILDDDVVLPPTWIEQLLRRFEREPPTTALITTQVIEPGMPEGYLQRDDVQQEAYLCTFRGCGSLVRREVLERAEYYDERFFIYGNERDLAARILGLGYRILLDPSVATFHGTPFGMKAGQRSLYYHVRNFWLYAFKHCAWKDVLAAALRLTRRALSRSTEPAAAEATGTIGLQKSLSATPGGKRVAIKASLAALALLPHCLRNRQVCQAPDFRPPLQ